MFVCVLRKSFLFHTLLWIYLFQILNTAKARDEDVLKISNPRTSLGFLKRIFTDYDRPGTIGTGGGGGNGFFGQPFPPSYQSFDSSRKGCPLCDSSVYSYCSDKLLHDACCCLDPYEDVLPYQCRFADCSFLHANTCREHRLITRCCCNNLYLAKNS